MKHLTSISKTTVPARATNLLEWSQIGSIVGVFVTAFGAFATAFNTFTTAFKTKGNYDN